MKEIVDFLKKNNLKITTMESCTSGSLISAITNIEGSSAVTDGGFITYSNKAKIQAGVSEKIIEIMGVYSTETAVCMGAVAMTNLDANIGIGVTGTFSNVDPNNSDSISGEVHYAIVWDEKVDEIINPLIKEDLIESIFYKTISIPTTLTERSLQKLYVVYDILESLKILFNML